MVSNRKKILSVSIVIDHAFSKVTRASNTKRLAVNTKDKIVKRTRLGRGLTSKKNGSLIKLKPLSRSYILQRKGKLRFFTGKQGQAYALQKIGSKELTSLRASTGAKKQQRNINKLLKVKNRSRFTRPGKSNMTATNQLLRAFKGVGRTAQIIIELSRNARVGDLWDKSKRVSATNTKILKWQEASGRIFFGLSKTEKGRLERIIGKEILDTTDRLLKAL